MAMAMAIIILQGWWRRSNVNDGWFDYGFNQEEEKYAPISVAMADRHHRRGTACGLRADGPGNGAGAAAGTRGARSGPLTATLIPPLVAT